MQSLIMDRLLHYLSPVGSAIRLNNLGRILSENFLFPYSKQTLNNHLFAVFVGKHNTFNLK
jgi:hypothetical protein